MVSTIGLHIGAERPASAFGAGRVVVSGAPGEGRTPDRRLRRPLLYPLSYRGVRLKASLTGAKDGVRTRDIRHHKPALYRLSYQRRADNRFTSIIRLAHIYPITFAGVASILRIDRAACPRMHAARARSAIGLSIMPMWQSSKRIPRRSASQRYASRLATVRDASVRSLHSGSKTWWTAVRAARVAGPAGVPSGWRVPAWTPTYAPQPHA